MYKQNIITYLVFVLAMVLISVFISAQDTTSETTDLVFVNHLQAGLIEQDVYVQNEEGQAVRLDNTAPISTLYQPVVGTKAAQSHDPYGLFEGVYGPFESGEDLGFTLAEWLQASATGTYTVTGDRALLVITAEDLVPNGVYTVWCTRLIPPPDFRFIDLPCGAADSTENVFVASEDGSYTYVLELDPLDPATPENIPLVALAYQSDGKTYGERPGDFGMNSHVQIFAMIAPTE